MLTPLGRRFLVIIKVLIKGLIFGLLFFPYMNAAINPLPSSLPDADVSSASSIPVNIKTPEYVIIRAAEETTFSSETTGMVINLPVKEGSYFKAGDSLLTIDCRLQQADLNKAKAQQRATNKALESAKKLKAYGTLSEFEFVKATADADAVDADVDKLQTIIEKCSIIAPFSGGVSEVMVHLYETIKPGDPLLKVISTKKLFLEIQAPSQWLTWLHIGSRFNVYINDIHKMISANVIFINPQIEPISQTVKITGQILSRELSLRPGMTGQAIFPDNPDSGKE